MQAHEKYLEWVELIDELKNTLCVGGCIYYLLTSLVWTAVLLKGCIREM